MNLNWRLPLRRTATGRTWTSSGNRSEGEEYLEFGFSQKVVRNGDGLVPGTRLNVYKLHLIIAPITTGYHYTG